MEDQDEESGVFYGVHIRGISRIARSAGPTSFGLPHRHLLSRRGCSILLLLWISGKLPSKMQYWASILEGSDAATPTDQAVIGPSFNKKGHETQIRLRDHDAPMISPLEAVSLGLAGHLVSDIPASPRCSARLLYDPSPMHRSPGHFNCFQPHLTSWIVLYLSSCSLTSARLS